MRKYISKKSIVLVALALLLAVAVGTTLAYIFTNTGPIQNTFKPSKVSCEVVEGFKDSVKSDVQIKNTGDTDAYIRVAVVITWKSADGTKVWAQKPIENTDYTIDWAYDDEGNATSWTPGDDGYYYYNASIAPQKSTGNLINEAKLKEGCTAPVGTDNTQYYLSIEIVASAIQAAPDNVVGDEWSNEKVIVSGSNGILEVTNKEETT